MGEAGLAWPREGEGGGRSPEVDTGAGGAEARVRKRRTQVAHEMREDEATLLVQFAWPVAA
jgi:hypothetical protein